MRDVPEPTVDAGQVLVRARSVGICGTDRSIYQGTTPVDHPRILGHEVVGEVLDASADRSRAPGQRVLVDPGIACGACRQCLEGRPNICTHGWLLGRDRDGGLREMLDVPVDNVHPVPDAIGDDVAPMLQVLATCVHAQRLVPVFVGDRVVVLGLGVSGLLHVQLAKLRGAAPIVGVTRSSDKRVLAERFGADHTVAADGDEVEAAREATGGGADLVIECVGSAATFGRAIQMARVGGRVLCYGTITDGAERFPFYDLYYKELSISNPRSAQPRDFPAAIELVASGRVALEPLVSRRFDLASAGEALAASNAGGLKVLVDL